LRAPRPFPWHAEQTLTASLERADRRARGGQRAGSADADNAAGPNRPAGAGGIAPEGSTTGQRAEPLGDKLAKSDGVLCPPAGVDPEIRAPTPDTGNTPVIPPPGSPGGDPNVRPK
jgi:hypothetical protein